MNILIPVLGFSRSGGARVLAEFASHWIALGHKVDFLTADNGQEPYFPTKANIIRYLKSGEIKTSVKSVVFKSTRFNAFTNIFSMYCAISKIENNYDLILANHSLTAWPVNFVKTKAKKFYYVQAYEPEYYQVEQGVNNRIKEWLSRKSYSFNLFQICNAPIYLNYREIKALDWVAPGIDFNLFYPRKTNKDLQSSPEIILGCIGRSEPGKGIKYVLDAFSKLWEHDKRYKLFVAYGNLPESWKSHPGLNIITPKNDIELGNFYRSLDIMIAPGIVQLGAAHYPVMEAMACGVPVINTGYLPSCSKNAWIVPIKESDPIVHAIKEITEDSNLRNYKIDLANSDIQPFGWQNAAKKMIEIFNKFNL